MSFAVPRSVCDLFGLRSLRFMYFCALPCMLLNLRLPSACGRVSRESRLLNRSPIFRPYAMLKKPKVSVMDAWVNDRGIRLRGLGHFKASTPKGTLDSILDKLQARTLQNGKRLYLY